MRRPSSLPAAGEGWEKGGLWGKSQLQTEEYEQSSEHHGVRPKEQPP